LRKLNRLNRNLNRVSMYLNLCLLYGHWQR